MSWFCAAPETHHCLLYALSGIFLSAECRGRKTPRAIPYPDRITHYAFEVTYNYNTFTLRARCARPRTLSAELLLKRC